MDINLNMLSGVNKAQYYLIFFFFFLINFKHFGLTYIFCHQVLYSATATKF